MKVYLYSDFKYNVQMSSMYIVQSTNTIAPLAVHYEKMNFDNFEFLSKFFLKFSNLRDWHVGKLIRVDL